MTFGTTRREFMGRVAAGLATAGMAGLPYRSALAADPLRAMSWGGMWLENMKAITDSHDPIVNWSPFTEGSGGLIARQKAVWPNLLVDLTANWDPNYGKMYREGWLATVTENDVPNLADIEKPLLKYRDDTGVYGVPMSFAGFMWGYRNDLVDVEIRDIEDLLHPDLKGKICATPPGFHMNLTVVSLAMGLGGDEHNQEPGWEFTKKLAEGGYFGRVAATDVDIINSINLGETAVAFQGVANWNAIKQNHPTVRLNKVPGSKGMKTFYYSEGFCIFKGPRQEEAASAVNHLIAAENCERYNAAIGQMPSNTRSAVPESASDIAFTAEEIEQYVVYPDYEFHSRTQADAIKRWEQEIQPLIRMG